MLAALLVGLTLDPRPAHAVDPVKQLIRILGRASDYKQRLAATIGLARHGDRRAVPALIKALSDRHHTVRGAAARVLAKLGDQRARPALEALLLRSKNDFVRGQAQKALAALMRAAEGKKPGRTGQMQVHGILGTLDQEAIQDGIHARKGKAKACFRQLLQAAPYLAGKVTLRFRVTTGGKVKWVRFKHSDVGSREVERCVLEEMRKARFEAPKGGEAEFVIPLTFHGSGYPVTTLDPDSSAAAQQLRRSCRKLLRGKRRRRLKPPRKLRVVLYIAPNGTVVSAGLSAGGAEIPEDFAQQLTANLKQLNLQDPSLASSYGKLACNLTCR